MLDGARASQRLASKPPLEGLLTWLIFLGAWAYFRLSLHLTFEIRDEGYLYSVIAQAAHGEVPHRDFVALYGPGFHALTGAVFRAFGERVLPIRELIALFRAAAVAFSYLAARQLVPRSFALLAAFISAAYWGKVIWNLNSPYPALFSISLCAGSLVLLMQGQARGSARRIFGAGFVCGAALMFKWSLAAVSAYGMVLALCAQSMIRGGSQPPGSRAERSAYLVAWALAGMAIVAPFFAKLSVWDYLLHFAPIHAVLVLLGVWFARYGDTRATLASGARPVLAYCTGFLVIPILAVGLYLWWGALDDLFYDMVIRPLNYRNYQISVPVPGVRSVALLGSALAWVGAGLSVLRGSLRVASGFTLLGTALAPVAYQAIESTGMLGWAAAASGLTLQLPTIIALSGVASLALFFRRRSPIASSAPVVALIAALLFQEMMSFSIFPRATFNVTLIGGTMAPLLAYLSHRAYLASKVSGRGVAWRAAGFSLAALPALLIVVPIVLTTLASPRFQELEPYALPYEALEGIRPDPRNPTNLDLPAFNRLQDELKKAEPADAPVFFMGNSSMVTFVSGREPLFGEYALTLYLAGWNFLPEDDRDAPEAELLIQRLKARPETIVLLDRSDPTLYHFLGSYPRLQDFIRSEYRVEKAIGDFRILRARSWSGRSAG